MNIKDIQKYKKFRSLRKTYSNINNSIKLDNINNSVDIESSKNRMSHNSTLNKSLTNINGKKNYIPKVDIESVIIEKSNTTGSKTIKSLSKVLSTPTNNNLVQGQDKQFYYSRKNEMLSVKKFLDFYQSTESQRKLVDKQRLRKRVEEAREKVQEIQLAMGSSSQKKLSRMKLTCSEAATSHYESLRKNKNVDELCYTPNSNLAFSKSSQKAFMIESPSNFDSFPQERRENESPINPDSINQYDNLHQSDDFQTQRTEYHKKSASIQDQKISMKVNDVCLTPDAKRVHDYLDYEEKSTKKKKTFNEPKFTEREIYRHLIHLTVSPHHKTLQDTISSINKERKLQTLFKDPKVMDCRIELSLKKNEELNPRRSSKLFGNLSNIGVKPTINTNDEIDKNQYFSQELSSKKAEDEFITRSISTKINNYVKNIDNFLRINQPNLVNPLNNHSPIKQESSSFNFKQKEISLMGLDSTPNQTAKHMRYSSSLTNITLMPNEQNNSLTTPKTPNKKFISRKIPLRAEIERKYNIVEKINNNKRITQEVKTAVIEAKKKLNYEIGIKNRCYIDLYL